LAGQIRPVLLRQGHYFGHSLGGNAHAARISASRPELASAMMLHRSVAKQVSVPEKSNQLMRLYYLVEPGGMIVTTSAHGTEGAHSINGGAGNLDTC
jgi:hypothetical protein